MRDRERKMCRGSRQRENLTGVNGNVWRTEKIIPNSEKFKIEGVPDIECPLLVKFRVFSPLFQVTPCLSTPFESTSESSPVEMRPTKSVPSEQDLDFQPPRCVLVTWVTPRKILNCWCSPVNFWSFDIFPVILLRQSLVPG